MLDDYDIGGDGKLPADSAGHSGSGDTRPDPRGPYQDSRYGDPQPGLPINRREPNQPGSGGGNPDTSIQDAEVW